MLTRTTYMTSQVTMFPQNVQLQSVRHFTYLSVVHKLMQPKI